MAIGFCCRDGVVIGADRQITGVNYTFPECKLITLNWKNGSGIVAYSGDRDTSIVFAKEIGQRLRDDPMLDDEQIAALLKECIAVSTDKKETFLALFGYWLDGGFPSLIMSNVRRKIVPVPECDVIGYADSPLARSLLGRFSSLPHHVSVHQARIYALSFISQAKKYDGQYVGDSIDIYSIDERTNPGVPISLLSRAGKKYIRVLDAGQTAEWENEINSMNYWMDVLFSQVTDDEGTVWIAQFMERLKSFREWSGGEPL